MFGIIATIIAARKGRTVFAWIIGVWTALAFVLYFMGSGIGIAPGVIFLYIAATMDDWNVNRRRVIFYCQSCGFLGSDRKESMNTKCPECGETLIKSDMILADWKGLSEEKKAEYKHGWGLPEQKPQNADSTETVCTYNGNNIK